MAQPESCLDRESQVQTLTTQLRDHDVKVYYLKNMFYLINMLQKKYKVIDIKDKLTNISIIGLIEIEYNDNFNLKNEFN